MPRYLFTRRIDKHITSTSAVIDGDGDAVTCRIASIRASEGGWEGMDGRRAAVTLFMSAPFSATSSVCSGGI